MTVTQPAPARQRHARHRAAPKAPKSGPGAVAVLVGGIGELLITLGLVLLLFCGYQLFYTNLPANQAMDRQRDQLQQQWDGQAASTREFAPGEGFAILHIPRLGKDYAKPILEGVALDDLARGVGHYSRSVMPGKVGNFAVAGHRATHGEPFKNLPNVQPGDPVIVETADTWYVYQVEREMITVPTDVEVVLPVPGKPSARPTEKLITLTTCHPRWASTKRYIVFGKLAQTLPKASGKVPPELTSA